MGPADDPVSMDWNGKEIETGVFNDILAAAGDDVEVDFDSGMIYNKTKGTEFKGQAFPEFMQKIIKAEGLVNYINANTTK